MSQTNSELSAIVARGELYKQTRYKIWVLRHFILGRSKFLAYESKDGKKKSNIDISYGKLKILTPEECGDTRLKFAFSLITRRKTFVLCASSERNRVAWMILLHQTIESNKSIARYLFNNEETLASSVVKKKGMFFSHSIVKMTVTNYPRMILTQTDEDDSLINQISWDKSSIPVITKVNSVFLSYI